MLIRSTALAAALALGMPAALADTTPAPAVVEVQNTVVPRLASRADETGYAARERHDTQVARYRGGGIIIIGLSSLAVVVLAVVIVLVLI